MGRVLCKMLLPQKEEHLPHIAVRAVKYYGISGGGFFQFSWLLLLSISQMC